MKTQKTILFTLAVTLIAATMTFAQSNNNSQLVKILPHNEEGFVRLLYMGDQSESVIVRFYKGNTLLSKDKVETGEFQKGFIKLYDVRHLKDGSYKVKVTSDGNSIAHSFIVSENEPIWGEYWNTQLQNNSYISEIESEDTIAIASEN